MAAPSDKHLSRRQWVEVATVAFLVALLAWLLNRSFASSYVSPDAAYEPPGEASGSAPLSIAGPTLQSLGIPPLQLPGQGCNCGGCMGCAAGSSADASIGQIVAQANAALSQIQAASYQTADAMAALGDESGGGYITYTVT